MASRLGYTDDPWVACKVLVCIAEAAHSSAAQAMEALAMRVRDDPLLSDSAGVLLRRVDTRVRPIDAVGLAQALTTYAEHGEPWGAASVALGVVLIDANPAASEMLLAEIASSAPMAKLRVRTLAIGYDTLRPPPDQTGAIAVGTTSAQGERDAAAARQLEHIVLQFLVDLTLQVQREPEFAMPIRLVRQVTARPEPAPAVTALPAQGEPREVGPRQVELASITTPEAEGLFYLVMVADSGRPSRRLRRRRKEVGSSVLEAVAKQEWSNLSRWWFSLYYAGDRARSAGVYATSQWTDLKSKVAAPSRQFLDLYRCGDDLADVIQEHREALARRNRPVGAVHVVVLSAELPLGDVESLASYERLCRSARVTWILFDQDRGLMPARFSGDNSRVMVDHADIVRAITTHMQNSQDDIFREGIQQIIDLNATEG